MRVPPPSPPHPPPAPSTAALRGTMGQNQSREPPPSPVLGPWPPEMSEVTASLFLWGGDREQPAAGPDLPDQTSPSHLSPEVGCSHSLRSRHHRPQEVGGQTACRPTWPGFGTQRAGVGQERGGRPRERPRTRGVLVTTVQRRGPNNKNVFVVFVESSFGPNSTTDGPAETSARPIPGLLGSPAWASGCPGDETTMSHQNTVHSRGPESRRWYLLCYVTVADKAVSRLAEVSSSQILLE